MAENTTAPENATKDAVAEQLRARMEKAAIADLRGKILQQISVVKNLGLPPTEEAELLAKLERAFDGNVSAADIAVILTSSQAATTKAQIMDALEMTIQMAELQQQYGLDEEAVRRVKILSSHVDWDNREAVMQFTRATVELTDTPPEIAEAQAGRLADWAKHSEQGRATTAMHDTISGQAHAQAAAEMEQKRKELKAVASDRHTTAAHKNKAKETLDIGAGAHMKPDQKPTEANLDAAIHKQKEKNHQNATALRAALPEKEKALLGDMDTKALFARRKQILGYSGDDNIDLRTRQLIFEASNALNKPGADTSHYPEHILKDAAALNFTGLVISTGVVQNLTNKALLLDKRYEAALSLKGEVRTEAVYKLMVEHNSNIAQHNPKQVKAMVRNAVEEIDERGGIAGIRTMTDAQRESMQRETLERSLGAQRNAIIKSSQEIAMSGKIDAKWDPVNIKNGRFAERHEEGASFLELEFRDVVGIINKHDSSLAKKMGGADGKIDSKEAIQLLENAGIISQWTETADNRQNSGLGYSLAAAAKLGVDNAWSRFGKWNDQNLKRIDLNGDGQIGGNEAWEALRLAQYIKENPAVMKEISVQLKKGGITPGQNDINKDGKVDVFEAARALMNHNIASPAQIDSAQEFKAALATPSAGAPDKSSPKRS